MRVGISYNKTYEDVVFETALAIRDIIDEAERGKLTWSEAFNEIHREVKEVSPCECKHSD